MEEESSELPLSKRINNLHINNFSGIQERSPERLEQNWGNQNFVPSPNHSEPSQGSSSCDGYSSSHSSYSEYSPVLSATDNPIYYENNKLLYTLHMERLQRIENHY